MKTKTNKTMNDKLDKTDAMIQLLKKRAKAAKTQQERDEIDRELAQLQAELAKKRPRGKWFVRLPIEQQIKLMEEGKTPFEK
jgi:cob(I)alamin adenosyltransferase